MKSKCNFYELFILYIFSAFYLLKEIFMRIFVTKSSLNGQVFLRCEGRTALITGGTSGVGLETAKKLLGFGMNVIIGSNSSAEKSRKCVEELRMLFPKCKVEIWYVDLSSMSSVKAFAEKYLLSGLPLHILINNAAIMMTPYKITEDGFESQMAVNYFSHCLLTKLLLPRLKQSGSSHCKARIINVSSSTHYLGEIDFQDLNSINSYCPHHSYTQSKLGQVMFTKRLNDFLSMSGCDVVVHALHPGIIYSSLYQHIWWASYLGPIFFKKPVKGAEVVTYAALSTKLENEGGKFIEDFATVKPSSDALKPELQNRMWNLTWKILQPWLDEIDDVEPDMLFSEKEGSYSP